MLDSPSTTPPGPHWNVEVDLALGSPEYLMVAEWIHGHDNETWFVALGDLLGGRPGWHCDLTREGILWSYGALGASLFNISPPTSDAAPDHRFSVFDYEQDETFEFAGTDALREWLDANEGRHADYARKARAVVAAFDWGVLKSGFTADITIDGDTWVGTVRTLPMEATFATSLATLVANLREMIGQVFDAPAAVIPEIAIVARLDAKAAAHLTA
jgi:predicted RNase H-like HicB family nuclease